MKKFRKIAIVGVGPRGGYGFERLILELSKQSKLSNLHLTLFEATGNFGNGQVYDLNQNPSNWLNITERILELEKREAIENNVITIPSFPSYHQWIQKDFDNISAKNSDTYPPRAQLGKYLSERFQSLIQPLVQADLATLYAERITELSLQKDHKIIIASNTATHEPFDELLLTIGHQPTELSEQIAAWENYATANSKVALFSYPYPVTAYLEHEQLTAESKIGIRGFGLAMIDVVRAIANKFGRFESTNRDDQPCSYKSEYEMKSMFMPFSLDGLPPVPKPLNAQVDSWFKPSDASLNTFGAKIGDTATQKSAASPDFLIKAIAPIVAEVFASLPNSVSNQDLSNEEDIEKLTTLWLQDQSFEHQYIVSTKQSAVKSIQAFVGMATGKSEISLDYCIGQVWRHCQPTIYEQLSFNACADEVIAAIIALDESTKRYSYGPPVASMTQLLALVDAGVLNLTLANDPAIELSDQGWKLSKYGNSSTVSMMIDSVLDSPKIKAVKSPIVKALTSQDLVEAVHDDLGVVTDDNGYLIPLKSDQIIPIAFLGRLAKGTVIGVDAILECFGPRPRQWAKEASNRHVNWLKNFE